MKLRPYQEDILKAMRNFKGRGGLVVSPTGSGKSVIVQEISKDYKSVLIVAPIKLLVKQYEQKYGLPSICYKSLPKVDLSSYDLILFDEAHSCSRAGLYFKDFIKDYKGQYFGLTATPYRENDDMILKDKFFTEIIYTIETFELTRQGYLAPLVFQPMEEYNDYLTQFAKININKIGREGDILCDFLEEIFKKESKNGLILVFLPIVDVANEISILLTERGYTSKVVHSKKKNNIEDIEQYNFCLNVNMLTTGFDLPSLKTIVIARMTKSINMYFQILGRGTRILEGKEQCNIYDCSYVYKGIEDYSYSMPMQDCVAFIDTKLSKCTNKDCDNHFLDRQEIYCPECSTIGKFALGHIKDGAIFNATEDILMVPPYSYIMDKDDALSEFCSIHNRKYSFFGRFLKRCPDCWEMKKNTEEKERESKIVDIEMMHNEEITGLFICSIKRASFSPNALQVTFKNKNGMATYALFPPYHEHTRERECSKMLYSILKKKGISYENMIIKTEDKKNFYIKEMYVKMYVHQTPKGYYIIKKIIDLSYIFESFELF